MYMLMQDRIVNQAVFFLMKTQKHAIQLLFRGVKLELLQIDFHRNVVAQLFHEIQHLQKDDCSFQ